jgi:RND family efflux transporter MFP subunit
MPVLRSVFFVLAGLLAIDAAAQEPLLLNSGQLKSLGVEVALPLAGAAGGPRGLPAHVVVPVDQMRVVAAPVAGMVEMLAVAPGAAVKRGQVVAQLASPQALELQSGALQAGSQAQLAQQNLKRDEQLFAEGLIAESRLHASRAVAVQAGALASERRQGLTLAGVAPGKVGGPLALLAPIDGVVLEQGANVGQRVDASTMIYRIAKLSPLWLEIQAPVALAGGLKVGAPVRVAGTAAKGKLITVGRAVEAGNQSIMLRAAVDNGAEALRPGQAVEVEVEAAAASGMRLPAAALIRHQGKAVVFVQAGSDAKGTAFRAQAVQVLGQNGDSVLVDGLKAGEHVAVRGVSGLKAIWTGVGKE